VDGFKVYGNERYIYQYISDKYSQPEIKFDISKIKLFTIDIEVASENGFPDVENAAEEVLLITIQDYTTKEIITWGQGPFKLNKGNLYYKRFNNEYDLLNVLYQLVDGKYSRSYYWYGIVSCMIFHILFDVWIESLVKS